MKARVTFTLIPKLDEAKRPWRCIALAPSAMRGKPFPLGTLLEAVRAEEPVEEASDPGEIKIIVQVVDVNPDGSLTFDPVSIPATHYADIEVDYFDPADYVEATL